MNQPILKSNPSLFVNEGIEIDIYAYILVS